MYYTVTCNPALDWMMCVPELQEGQINFSTFDVLSMGGKGVNVSTMLTRFDLPNIALGFCGGVTGHALIEGLHKLGVKTDFVELSQGDTRINVKLKRSDSFASISLDGTPNFANVNLVETEINGRGLVSDEAAERALFAKLANISDTDTLILSGEIAPGQDTVFYRELMSLPGLENVRVVVDATGMLLTNSLAAKPFLIKPNNEELAELAGISPFDRVALINAALELARAGAQYVLVSCGPDGAFLVDENGLVCSAKAPEGVLVNSVGAGDSMVAGFVAGYDATVLPGSKFQTPTSKDLVYALRFGVASGSASAFCDTLAQRNEVAHHIDKVEIDFVRS